MENTWSEEGYETERYKYLRLRPSRKYKTKKGRGISTFSVLFALNCFILMSKDGKHRFRVN